MKILLLSIGTRGDMEPFLAIGELLREKGHRVICVFPEQFRNLAEESNLEFASLGTSFIEMLDSADGKVALGGSGSGIKKILAYVRLARGSKEINKELIHKQHEIVEREKPDRIVYNGKAVYPLIWGLDRAGMTTFISPVPFMHYVKNHTHVAFNSNYGSFLNKLTYSLANFGMVVTTMMSIKWLKISRKITRKQVKNALITNKAIYSISPSLFSRPNYWHEQIKVLGYHERGRAVAWQPDKALTDFLNAHDQILFITFGSMTNPHPEEKTNLIIDILERNRIPAIINTASGGLIKPDNFNSGFIHFVSRVPYDRIFPKMYGVIHHGGSGTTHMALKNGCASMIIPHIIDQFVWNKIVFTMGAGPIGMKIDRLTTKSLEPKILELMNNPSYKLKAEEVAGRMAKEDFRGELYQAIIEN